VERVGAKELRQQRLQLGKACVQQGQVCSADARSSGRAGGRAGVLL
jgi:hypothetical protein